MQCCATRFSLKIIERKEETHGLRILIDSLRKAISRTRYGRKIFLPTDNPEDHSYKDFFEQANPNSIRSADCNRREWFLTRLHHAITRFAASSSYFYLVPRLAPLRYSSTCNRVYALSADRSIDDLRAELRDYDCLIALLRTVASALKMEYEILCIILLNHSCDPCVPCLTLNCAIFCFPNHETR